MVKYEWDTPSKKATTGTSIIEYEWDTPEKIETPKTTTRQSTTGKENLFGTVGNLATAGARGFLNAAEGISDLIQYGVAGVAGLVGAKKTKDWFLDAAKMNATKVLTKTAEEYYNPRAAQGFKEGQFINQVAEGVGGVAANIGMAGVGGKVAGTAGKVVGQYAPTFLGSTGSGISEGLNAGVDGRTAVAYGLGQGAIQTGSELLFGGIGGAFGKGALDDLVVKNITKNIKTPVLKNLASLGIKAVGEGIEENIAGVLAPELQKMTIDPNATSYFKTEDGKITLKKAGRDFLVGMVTSALAQTPGTISNISNETDLINQLNNEKEKLQNPDMTKKEMFQTKKSIKAISDMLESNNYNVPSVVRNNENNATLDNIAQPMINGTPNITNGIESGTISNNIKPQMGQDNFAEAKGTMRKEKTSVLNEPTNLYSTIEKDVPDVLMVELDATQEKIAQEKGLDMKQRGVLKSLANNQGMPSEIRKGAKKLDGHYMVITNDDALNKSAANIAKFGDEGLYQSFKNRINNNEMLSKYDIIDATLLANNFWAKGQPEKYWDLVSDIAVYGTAGGQIAQATSILQRATPDGKLMSLQKQINKINEEYKNKKGFDPITMDIEDVKKIKNARSKDDLDNAVNNAIVNISKKIPRTLGNALNEWRYLAMLGNPKTHIRNLTSNLAMKGVSKAKNTLSALIEDIAKPNDRTRTLQKASQKTIDFAKQDAEAQKSRIQGTDKYDQGKGKLRPEQNKLSKLNSKGLELEDWLFSRPAYIDAMKNYITANNLDVDTMTPKQLETARQFATDQAQEQTFRTFSKFAESIGVLEKKNAATKLLIGATLPFKTTPINIAKAGIEYSPVGLIKTVTKNVIDLKNGKITSAKFIDNLSKGLTGSAIATLGFILADSGLLTASGSDEDKEKYFQEMQGKQPYSIRIGNKTITLDWLSPSAMPFFMGAEIAEMKKDGLDTSKLVNIASAIGTIIDPLTEMSMLQGLNKTMAAYDKNKLGAVVTNTLQNYALQYIPTISGQLARTLTPERKSTTGKGTGIEKQFGTFVNKVKAKLPIIANTLEPYTDQFGNKEITNSIAERAFENFISPAFIKDVKTEKVYDEIQKLYDKTGETSILPTSASRYFTQNGKKIYLTPEEYTKFNTIDGQNSLKMLNNFVNSSNYKSMSDEAKVKSIENFYRASQKIAKANYMKGK